MIDKPERMIELAIGLAIGKSLGGRGKAQSGRREHRCGCQNHGQMPQMQQMMQMMQMQSQMMGQMNQMMQQMQQMQQMQMAGMAMNTLSNLGTQMQMAQLGHALQGAAMAGMVC